MLLSMLALIVMQGLIVLFSAGRSYNNMVRNADEIIYEVYAAYPGRADTDARYFTVVFKNGRVSDMDLSHIVTVKRKGAESYGRTALEGEKEAGFLGDFRYRAFREGDAATVIFLARGGNIEALKKNTVSLALVSAAGLGAMLVLLIIASKYVVRPVAASYQKQREFITSASHELKTPLTVIQADLDILQMEGEDNQWLRDIRANAAKLSEMTHSLVALARMEEAAPPVKRIEFPVSDLVEDVAKSYQALALKEGKELISDIAPGLSYRGDENLIRQLLSILLDNAFKYGVPGDKIELSLKKAAGGIALSVTNSVESLEGADLSRFFDRFYRARQSGSAPQRGFGLGLPIAEQIVKCHNGRITAKAPDERHIVIAAVLK